MSFVPITDDNKPKDLEVGQETEGRNTLLSPEVDKLLKDTPCATLIIFTICIMFTLIGQLALNLLVMLRFDCIPSQILDYYQLYRLPLSFLINPSLLSLVISLALVWRRFVWLEHVLGSIGLVCWLVLLQCVLNLSFVILAIFASPFVEGGFLNQPSFGFWPLVICLLANDNSKNYNSIQLTHSSSDAFNFGNSGYVWLWPLPFHISTSLLPFLVMGLNWLLCLEVQLSSLSALFCGYTLPIYTFVPSSLFLSRFEKHPLVSLIIPPSFQRKYNFIFRAGRYNNEVEGENDGLLRPINSLLNLFGFGQFDEPITTTTTEKQSNDCLIVNTITTVKDHDENQQHDHLENREVVTLDEASDEGVILPSYEFESEFDAPTSHD